MRGIAGFGLAALMILSACGGGSGSSSGTAGASNPPGSNAPASNPPPTPASVTFAGPSSLSFTGDNGASRVPIEDQSIGISVTNPSAGTLWSRARIEGAPVSSADIVWANSTAGRLRLLIRAPSTLGAGTYTGTVSVDICMDSTCAQHATGSPKTFAVSYVVSGSAQPRTRIYWSGQPTDNSDLTTADTRAPEFTLQISTMDIPDEGLYLRHTVSATGLITAAVFSQPTFSPQVGVAFGQYEITLQPPSALGSGIFQDSMTFEACFDQACTSVVPNSRHTVDFDILVTATAGVEFVRKSVAPSTGATAVVWSAADQSLYLAASAYASAGALVGVDPQVLRIDPLTLSTSASVTLPGENLQNMAVTPDGSYLYVGSKTRPAVHRLQLPALTEDLSVPLGDFSPSTPYLANDLATIPGQPRSFVVAVRHGSSHGGVYVYDDATARPDSLQPVAAQAFEFARWLVPAATPGTYISQNYGPSQPQVNNIEQLTVGPTGISVTNSTPTASGLIAGGKPYRAGNKLYTFDGNILDAATGALLGTLTLPPSTTPYALLPDEMHNRIFVWASVRQKPFIVSYDMTTLQLLGFAPVSAAGGVNSSMTLWGSEGVAIADGAQLIVMSGSFFSTYRPPSTSPTY